MALNSFFFYFSFRFVLTIFTSNVLFKKPFYKGFYSISKMKFILFKIHKNEKNKKISNRLNYKNIKIILQKKELKVLEMRLALNLGQM